MRGDGESSRPPAEGKIVLCKRSKSQNTHPDSDHYEESQAEALQYTYPVREHL